MKISDAELSTAIRILKQNSSILAVSNFLKQRDLTHSASSWDALVESRLKPALDEGTLAREDFLQLLRESEEFGRQHVFLFRCDRSLSSAITNEEELRKRLKKMDIEDLYSKPRIIDRSPGLQLVEVRLDRTAKFVSLVIKGVNIRRYRTLIKSEKSGNREILTYEWEEDRAVSVLRIRNDGLSEVRIQRHRNSVNYKQDVEDFFGKCAGVVDRLQFPDLSLAKTRLYMVTNRKELAPTVRFIEIPLRSKMGGELRATTGSPSRNMFDDDEELDGSVESFLKQGKGKSKCDAVNCLWLKQPNDAAPLSDIHTYIGGLNNEFIVLPHCERTDYEYVLEKITSFSK